MEERPRVVGYMEMKVLKANMRIDAARKQARLDRLSIKSKDFSNVTKAPIKN